MKASDVFYGFFYRRLMKLAHRFNWHYAPPVYPNGDTQLWRRWCGFRQTIKRRNSVDKRREDANFFKLVEMLRECIPVEPEWFTVSRLIVNPYWSSIYLGFGQYVADELGCRFQYDDHGNYQFQRPLTAREKGERRTKR